MNLSQKQAILNSIESILSFDFDQSINDNNVSGNIDDIKFGEYSVSEFKSTYLKVFQQLKAELENGLGLMLPNQESFYNEFGSATLDTESVSFYNYLQNFSNRDNAAEILKRFVYYQIRQGFWNKSSVKQHNVDGEKLKGAQESLMVAEKLLSKNLKTFSELDSDFKNKLDELKAGLIDIKTKNDDLTSILLASETDGASITTLLESATANERKIVTLVTEFDSKLLIINKNIDEYADDYKKIKEQNETHLSQLKEFIEEARKNLDNSKEGNKYIQDQRTEITRLIGMAADGSLGYKFNNRKEDLENGIKRFWRWAVPGSIIIALVWVIIIFTSLSAHLGNEWINLLINLIKTSPAWLLVGFVFSQYGKERDLQEEYAFKSAIAMTLTAYSEMLSEDVNNKNVSKTPKQEMLLKSIENLYTQPILKIEKPENGELINSKQLIDSLKSIVDMVKSVKN